MLDLAYDTHGNPDNPAVLLLHGFMSCNAQWWANLPALSEHHHVISAELWGHGRSPVPEENSAWSIEAYLQQFETIRSHLGISCWHAIGQSYGAGLIIRYALACPDAVCSVVATNSRSAFSQPGEGPGQTNETSNKPKSNPLSGDFELRQLPYHPIHARRFPESIKAEMVLQADQMSREAIRKGGRLGATLNCVEAVADLKQPLLITNGQYEKSFQQDLVYLKQRYPHLNVADLPGGHSVNIEAAEPFNQAVLAFLSDHQSMR